ncbi:hypothetical protein COMA2_40143 [Candidatus Nitrospira nitrificans]|uniref:Uncharacterized protein n=1 Tax=Candidatus Nitrospira nitrificans TaxID=1742973 RepID=A0A0S4LMS6_9BACT|nr:hypothetical protein COMA2_40143 [Candidatus Nitrospira nitrificans]
MEGCEEETVAGVPIGLAQVLEYFDAPHRPHRPTQQAAFGFFNQNLVMDTSRPWPTASTSTTTCTHPHRHYRGPLQG